MVQKTRNAPPLTKDERYTLNQWKYWTARAQQLKNAEDEAMRQAGNSGRPYHNETYNAMDKARHWQVEFDKENAKPVKY